MIPCPTCSCSSPPCCWRCWRPACFSSLALGLALLLAGCGDLPRPFQGNPGATAERLARPPPARLAVAPPAEALLTDAGARAWADATAAALQARELPATAGPPRRGDWRLRLSAETRGAEVVPSYAVLDANGKEQGVAEGLPVPARAWAAADPAALRAAADGAAGSITGLLARIEAARRQSDPNSLVNRPARLYFTGVSGAPGDGNEALARLMRAKIPDRGITVQDTARGADYRLDGQVAVGPGTGGGDQVELQWVLSDADGHERGRAVQINDVPRGSLNRYWGDVAVAATDEAAGAVRDMVSIQSGRTAK